MESNNQPKIAFAGSGPYAEPVFEALAEDSDDLTLIVKKGTPPDNGISLLASGKNKEIREVGDKKEFHQVIQELNPDIVIVVSFGIIISGETLKIPQKGFINVHYSLLPEYRGPSPIQSAILNGDEISGITFQKMVEVIDEGDVIYQEEVPLEENDTTISLAEKMAHLSAMRLPKILASFLNGELTPQKQSGKPTYSKIIKKEDGKIDWSESSETIERKVRAYTPWPGAYTSWNGKLLKIIEAESVKANSKRKTGVFGKVDGKYGIQTGNGLLVVKKLQLEGKKALAIEEFIRGNSGILGSTLGRK